LYVGQHIEVVFKHNFGLIQVDEGVLDHFNGLEKDYINKTKHHLTKETKQSSTKKEIVEEDKLQYRRMHEVQYHKR